MAASRLPDPVNVAVVRGTVASTPTVRRLPSGSSVVQLDVTTRLASGTTSVPVVIHDRAVDVVAGDDVVVVGHVARRFFRVGGATQSRTEVVADGVVLAGRAATAAKLVARALASLTP
jgi:single-strand DNA-binding protein